MTVFFPENFRASYLYLINHSLHGSLYQSTHLERSHHKSVTQALQHAI